MQKLNRKGAMAFRLTTLFYLTALVAAALAAFGGWGLLALPVVAIVPVVRWYCHNLRYAEGAMILVWFVIGLAAFALAGFAYRVGESAWRPVSQYYSEARRSDDRLVELSDVLDMWQPPQTSPPHSWRVHGLLRSPHYKRWLAGNYRFDEAWDSNFNRQSLLFDLYQIPSRAGRQWTHYLAIIDSRSAWREEGRLKEREITDGPENTLLLVETTSFNIAWNEPRDLTFDEAITLLTTEPVPESRDWHVDEGGMFTRDRKYRKVLTCDGQVIDIKIPIDRDNAIALLTAEGGEAVRWEEIELRGQGELDWGRIIPAGIFIALVLVPAIPAGRRLVALQSPSDKDYEPPAESSSTE